jgi:hypothetical protein
VTDITDFSALRKRLEELELNQNIPPCPVAKNLSTLDDDIREMVKRMIEDPGISITRLYNELRKSGIVFGRNSMGHHRAGTCTCSQREAAL